MAAISQTTFSSAFSWMKMYEFRLRFHWSLFLRVQLIIFQRCSDNGLTPTSRQAIIWPMVVSLMMHICVTQPQWVIGNFMAISRQSQGVYRMTHLYVIHWREPCIGHSAYQLGIWHIRINCNFWRQSSTLLPELGWGSLGQFSPFRYFPNFSEW